nr:NUDIX domain-containing protein [Fodinicola acaciae]
MHADAVATLGEWRPESHAQESLRQSYLAFLAGREDALRRSCAAGHLTASAAVFSYDHSKTLLTLHPRVGAWLQLGGHCEDDATLAAAALREATEESGIDGLVLDPAPVQLDAHAVTCSLGVPTRHLDVQFVAVAPAGAEAVRSHESLDLRWWPVDALPGDDASVRTLVTAALARLAAGSPTCARLEF